MSKPQLDETDVAQPEQQVGARAHVTVPERPDEEPGIVDEICVEELAIDGICGVY